MPASDHIALSFFAIKSQDFVYKVYRRLLSRDEESAPGTRMLPADCLVKQFDYNQHNRYVVSLEPQENFEEVEIRAWINPALTVEVLYQALLKRVLEED